MKKIITFVCISLFCILSLSAQERRGGREKIKALKIAYITEQLNLTTDEAQKFWTLYNVFDKEQHTLRSKHKLEIKKAIKIKGAIDSISEKDAENLITTKLVTDKQLYESRKIFTSKVKKVISYKKILKLQIAEREFGWKLMRKYKHKKQN
tara:strand:- start:91 stop:543 length:453 start_codon:yes stop_codon:yes gene_type:complete